jgi:hypothetical protein
VLFDAAITETIYRFESDTGILIIKRKNEAVVTKAMVIEELLLNWRIWEGAEEGVTDMLFRGLASLIREDHPYQAFNIKQFHSASVVDKIFCIYQVSKSVYRGLCHSGDKIFCIYQVITPVYR